jgi:integrase
MRRRRPYPHVHEYVDRHGKPRVYFRRGRQKTIPLPWPIGTREFVEAYQAAIETCPDLKLASTGKAGTIAALIALYYSSPEWRALAAETQRTYRNILERFREAHGGKPVAGLERRHVRAMIDAKAEKPGAANKFRKVVCSLLQFAVDHEWRSDNPALRLKAIKSGSEGFKTWSEEHIAQYEARHPLGSRARLALALLLYTGQRRADVVKMGRQHIKAGEISIRQQKTGAPVTLPIMPELAKCLELVPRDQLTFLVTEQGKPFTPAGFGNWFRDCCNEAGLRGIAAHGLRKAMCRRLAEAGCTPHEIMAISGHKTLAEIERYTAAVNRTRLARSAIKAIGKGTPNG